ncbi:MAG: aminotransferase class I/II-fold pyridoxal phosphate-dependent enzyme, partial [Spirochaetia bacterium]|nr:aminotransferase class I/II-fold pyridoxal phosphate-dependent enzyme [Spirochaetia bacterium]
MLNPIAASAKKRLGEGRGLLELHSPSYDFSSGFFPKKILEECFASFARDARYRPDPRGDRDAREAIARYYREAFDFPIDSEKLFLTSGTSESYAWLFRILSDSGGAERNRFLAPEPSYPLFEHIASHARVALDPFPVPVSRSESWDVSEAECQIRPETKGLLLVSPHNPTGKIHTQAELKSLEKIASEKNITLIHDEVFSEWVWNPSLSGKNFPRFGRMPGGKDSAPLHFTLNGVSKLLGLPWLKLS